LSRFFRELADFETKQTPEFQHPSLRGNHELEQMTVLKELEILGNDIYINTKEKQSTKHTKK
jgi:hypothetical protein